MTSATSTLSRPTIIFHWAIALLIIGMLAFGLYLENLPRGPEKGELIGLHVSFGLIVLVLASLRILWRLKERFPASLSEGPAWQERLALAVHLILLFGTVLMPISGILGNISGGSGISFFGMEIIASQRGNSEFVANTTLNNIAGAIHGIGGKLMIAAILLHVVGALKHHVIDRDGTLQRMLGRSVSEK